MFGKHADPHAVAEIFNEDMKAFLDLYDSEIYNCGFNPERIQIWNELVREMKEYSKDVVNFVWRKRVRASILGFNRRYSMVGPENTAKIW